MKSSQISFIQLFLDQKSKQQLQREFTMCGSPYHIHQGNTENSINFLSVYILRDFITQMDTLPKSDRCRVTFNKYIINNNKIKCLGRKAQGQHLALPPLTTTIMIIYGM